MSKTDKRKRCENHPRRLARYIHKRNFVGYSYFCEECLGGCGTCKPIRRKAA